MEDYLIALLRIHKKSSHLLNHFCIISYKVQLLVLYFLVFISGLLSATASLGLILLWDVGQGLTQMDKFFYAKEDYIRVI